MGALDQITPGNKQTSEASKSSGPGSDAHAQTGPESKSEPNWVESNCLVTLMKSAVNSAFIDPLRAVAQVVDNEAPTHMDDAIAHTAERLNLASQEPAKYGTADWYAQQLGSAAGMMVPMFLIRGGGGKVARNASGLLVDAKALEVGASESTLLSRGMVTMAGKEAAASGTSGFVYGTLLRTSDSQDSKTSFWSKRLSNGVSDLTTFGLLGATTPFVSKSLGSLASKFEKPIPLHHSVISESWVQRSAAVVLKNPAISGALAGIPGGALNAEMQAHADGRFLPTSEELKQNVVSMAFVGGTFGGAHSYLLKSRPEAKSEPSPSVLPEIAQTPTINTSRFESPKSAAAAFADLFTQKNWFDARKVIDVSPLERKTIDDPMVHDAAYSTFAQALDKGKFYEALQIISTGILHEHEYKTPQAKDLAEKSLPIFIGEGMNKDVQSIIDSGLVGEETYNSPSVIKGTIPRVSNALKAPNPEPLNQIRKWPWVDSEVLQQGAKLAVESTVISDRLNTVVRQRVAELGLLSEDDVNASRYKGLVETVGSDYGSLENFEVRAEEILGKDWAQDPDLRIAAFKRSKKALAGGDFQDVEQLYRANIISDAHLSSTEAHELAVAGLAKQIGIGARAGKEFKSLSALPIDISSDEIKPITLANLSKHFFQPQEADGYMQAVKEHFGIEFSNSEVVKAVKPVVSENLAEWYIQDADELINKYKLSEADVIHAAIRGLDGALDKDRPEIASALISRYALSPDIVQEALTKAVTGDHITSAIRTALGQHMDVDTAFEKYLGITNLDEPTARALYNRLASNDSAWQDDNNINLPFASGAALFGEAKMLRYSFHRRANPHDALHAFDKVIDLYHQSEQSPNVFYAKILSQVARDTGLDDDGTAYHRLNTIARNFPENIDSVLAKVQEHQDVPRLQQLADSLQDKKSIFIDWEHLQRFSKLQQVVEATELLPELKALRASGHNQLANWVEALAFHPDSRISLQNIVQFWKVPGKFLGLDDRNSGKAHDLKKPSNYTDIPHLDLTPEQLRDALINGDLDKIQVFQPMQIEYTVRPSINVGEEFDRALGSRRENRAGSAKNSQKLYAAVNNLLKSSDERYAVSDLISGKPVPAALEEPLKELLYNANFGLVQKDESLKFIAEIHRKSDPLAVLAGDDTASCMGFGTGKNNIYMFNPNDAQFTVRVVRPDGSSRTIAQSVLTKDKDIKASVKDVIEKMDNNESRVVHDLVPEAAMKAERAVIAADNVEVHPNYRSAKYPAALEAVYRDFFQKYLDTYGVEQNLRTDKIIIGKGYSTTMTSLPEEPNTFIPQAPAAYSDKTHSTVYTLSMDRPQQMVASASSIRVSPREELSTQTGSQIGGITPLTFEDSLPVAFLESKAYQDNPNLIEGLHNLENSLIAQSINNAAKERPNLSVKYSDATGAPKGYLLAHEGTLELTGEDKPVVFISDYSSDRRTGLDGKLRPGRAGGKLMHGFLEQYKKEYLDKGNLIPVFANAREETSYKLLVENMKALSRALGYSFEMQEVGTSVKGGSTMHNVLLTPGLRLS